MPPGQTILWMALVVLLCLTSALAADKKNNDSTDLVHDKQPENKTGVKLMEDKECDCTCDPTPCYNPTVPTPRPIFPMLIEFESSGSDCCQILEDAIGELNTTWTDLNSTAITLISVEKVANRCSYYDDVLKPCRFQCKLYPIMCHDPKQFVKELKCLKERPRQKTDGDMKMEVKGNGIPVELPRFAKEGLNALSACGKETMDLALTWIQSQEIGGVICSIGRKFLECAAKQSQADCGPIAKALYMNGYVWDDVTLAKQFVDFKTKDILKLDMDIRYPNLNWTKVDSDCLEYLNYGINSTLLGSSSSHNTAFGMLIAAVLVVCMLPLEITTTLVQKGPKAPLWMMAVLILGLATGLVLSDDSNPQCDKAPCTTRQCCSPKRVKIKLSGIENLCCQPFFQLSVIDKLFVEKVPPTVPPPEPIYEHAENVDILLAEETLKTRCGLYNESLKDCQKKCPLYGLICHDVPKFLEGLKCYHDKLKDLEFQVKVNSSKKGIDEWELQHPGKNRSWILCEEDYNITQISVPENFSNVQICANRLKYWLCVEKTFNETCPGIGSWLGLMNFFYHAKDVYYNVPDSIENDCLLYANYIGKHTSPPGSSSHAATSLGMVVAAIISGALGHRILMNFR